MSRSLVDLLPTPLHAEHLLALAPQHNSADLLQLLDRWVERGWLRALDRAFVSFLEERAPGSDPLLLLAAALARNTTAPAISVGCPQRPNEVRRDSQLATSASATISALASVAK